MEPHENTSANLLAWICFIVDQSRQTVGLKMSDNPHNAPTPYVHIGDFI